MEQKIDPPNLVFGFLRSPSFKLYLRCFQKISCVQMKLESAKKAKISENFEIF